ncbi:olfactory receptor 5V1-like [Engraulis encrasicolus]|uniref:olfactory receptor 5V1-like n=1 Tax=Engraulis encrasicolus TaxID=184585 RepID=UPI002FD76F29
METENTSVVRVAEFIITGFDHLSHQKLLGSIIFITYVLIWFFWSINMIVIIRNKALHSPMYIFIFNLAIVDILYTTSSNVTMIVVLLGEMKTISFNSCITSMFTYHLSDGVMILTITLMSADRMLAIRLPLRYHSILTNTRSFGLVAGIWIVYILSLSPVMEAAYSVPYCQPIIRYVFCDYPAMIRAACVNPEPYFTMPIVLGWWLWMLWGHFTIIFMTYVVIVWTVLRLPEKGSRRKMFTTCISHIIVVSAFYTPKIVSVLLTRIGLRLNLTERNAVLIVASTVPPLINPITYCLTTKDLRIRMIHLMKSSVVTK